MGPGAVVVYYVMLGLGSILLPFPLAWLGCVGSFGVVRKPRMMQVLPSLGLAWVLTTIIVALPGVQQLEMGFFLAGLAASVVSIFCLAPREPKDGAA